ncbi:MAG: tRNA (adenosine(37)-N6)-threonylcarbamoyltransferase complex dimerization subunit type 1 TsaB [candidate division Zixibacteria bacterium RBG_16_50_21]|nr:MAG: tRNA (adenosine(37)-N6)-threonylcarbamoyltransferase complex dimerization subunit type 1 TsaB [candidate division Zixibacteria bacterium RBG_16_50_21]
MIVLGLETSQHELRIGIVEESSVLGEQTWPAKGILAEIILDSIDQILQKSDLRLSNLSALAFSQGPGSFTGLRVGLATLKGLAWSHKIPLLAVPTFEVLAYQLGGREKQVAVLALARGSTFLGGVYAYQDDWPRLQGELFVTEVDTLNEKTPPSATVLILGPLADPGSLKKGLPGRQILINNEITIPRGVSVAKLGLERLSQNKTADPQSVEPIYLQKAVFRSKVRNERIENPPHA